MTHALKTIIGTAARPRGGRVLAGVAVLVATMAGCGSPTTAGGERPEDEAALIALEERQSEAWAEDGEAYAATLTEDADFVDVTGGHIRGRDVIAVSLQQGFDTFMAGTRISPAEERTIRFVSPDVAVVITSGVCVLKPGAEQCRPEDRSIQTRVAVKRDGDWLFTAFQNNRINPAFGG